MQQQTCEGLITILLILNPNFVLDMFVAEGSQFTGAMSKRDSASSPANHDHDEDGSISSGNRNHQNQNLLCSRCSSPLVPNVQTKDHRYVLTTAV